MPRAVLTMLTSGDRIGEPANTLKPLSGLTTTSRPVNSSQLGKCNHLRDSQEEALISARINRAWGARFRARHLESHGTATSRHLRHLLHVSATSHQPTHFAHWKWRWPVTAILSQSPLEPLSGPYNNLAAVTKRRRGKQSSAFPSNIH